MLAGSCGSAQRVQNGLVLSDHAPVERLVG